MPFARFTLRQLEAFATVAELHSFSAASDRLALTTQAVSRLVAELESVLGIRLFVRTTRRVRLSGAGREFLVLAETTLRHVRAAEKGADDVRNRASGIVRIGAPQALAGMVLPQAVREYQARQPKVVVRIVDVAVDQLVSSVTAGDVDLALGPDRSVNENVARQSLFTSRWVLWCSPEHPLAAQPVVKWSELQNVPLVAAGTDHEQSVAQMRVNAPADLRITPVDVVANLSTAMGIASQGLAATLAPAYAGVMARSFNLVMRRVVGPETVRQVCLYRNTNATALPAAEGFAEYLADWLPVWHRAQADNRAESDEAKN